MVLTLAVEFKGSTMLKTWPAVGHPSPILTTHLSYFSVILPSLTRSLCGYFPGAFPTKIKKHVIRQFNSNNYIG
jgi:hypothetical protein